MPGLLRQQRVTHCGDADQAGGQHAADGVLSRKARPPLLPGPTAVGETHDEGRASCDGRLLLRAARVAQALGTAQAAGTNLQGQAHIAQRHLQLLGAIRPAAGAGAGAVRGMDAERQLGSHDRTGHTVVGC